jgi:hypothetical protein
MEPVKNSGKMLIPGHGKPQQYVVKGNALG